MSSHTVQGALLLSGLVTLGKQFNQFILPHTGPAAHMSSGILAVVGTAAVW